MKFRLTQINSNKRRSGAPDSPVMEDEPLRIGDGAAGDGGGAAAGIACPIGVVAGIFSVIY
jgi:hypothetical protein